MAEIFADVVANIRADSTSLRAELLASEQAVTKSSKIIQTQLDSIVPRNRDLLGRFMTGRINMGSMLADTEKAGRATQQLSRHTTQARHSIQALQGSLFLLTGQTGFYAVEAVRAVTHVGKLASSTGGLAGGLLAVGSALRSVITGIGAFGATLVGIGAPLAAYVSLLGKAKDEMAEIDALSKKTNQEFKPLAQRFQDVEFATQKELGQGSEFLRQRTLEIRRLDRLTTPTEDLFLAKTVQAEARLELIRSAKSLAKNLNENTGAAFGIRAQSFIGNAPIGAFGEQREQKETAKNTAKTAQLLEQILKKLAPPNPLNPLSMGP